MNVITRRRCSAKGAPVLLLAVLLGPSSMASDTPQSQRNDLLLTVLTERSSPPYSLSNDAAEVREILAAMPNAEVARLILAARSKRLDYANGEKLYRRGLELLTSRAEQPHRWGLLYLLGLAVNRSGRLAEAEQLMRQARDLALKYHKPRSTAVFWTTTFLGMLLASQDKVAEALPLALRATQLLEHRTDNRKPWELSIERTEVGVLLVTVNEYERAEKVLLPVLADPHFESLAEYYRARTLTHLGRVSAQRRDNAQAIKYFEESLIYWPAVPLDYFTRQEIADTRLVLGDTLLEQQQDARAEAQYRLAADEYRSLGQSSRHATTLGMLGETLVMQRKYEEAVAVLAEGYWVLKGLRSSQQEIAFVAVRYGMALTDIQDFAAAEPLIREAIDGFEHSPETLREAAKAALALGQLQQRAGRPCDAKDAFQKSLALLDGMPAARRSQSEQLRQMVVQANAGTVCSEFLPAGELRYKRSTQS